MFDELFEQSHSLSRHRSGPLVEERRLYLHHLADQGISRSTLRGVAQYLLVVCDRLGLAARSGEMIQPAEIEAKADLWCKGRFRKSSGGGQGDSLRSRIRFRRIATQWLQFLGRLARPSTPPPPSADLIAAFADYMRNERGLSPRTIEYRCRTVDDFLKRLGPTKQHLRTLKPTEIDHALLEKITVGGYGRTTVQTHASTLRSFFRFAEMRGWCRSGLAMSIKGPRVFPQERLPVGPSWDEVQRLLATTEGDHSTDIRDRAILLLLAFYGLRAGEVRCLRLEDLDWEQELLLVRRDKTRDGQRYPLSRAVGDAVLRYLKEVRPRSPHREIFLTMRPPFRPLCSSGLWPIVARRLRSLGVALEHHGPHALRHACATRLLSQGLTLKEIGDHLGHRSPDTTRIYTKVDLAGLRQVAELDLGGLA